MGVEGGGGALEGKNREEGREGEDFGGGSTWEGGRGKLGKKRARCSLQVLAIAEELFMRHGAGGW